MAVYFAVFGRQVAIRQGEKTYESAKTLPAQTTTPLSTGHLEAARVVRLEAGSVSEAQGAIKNWYGGDVVGPVVCVTEAQFKES